MHSTFELIGTAECSVLVCVSVSVSVCARGESFIANLEGVVFCVISLEHLWSTRRDTHCDRGQSRCDCSRLRNVSLARCICLCCCITHAHTSHTLLRSSPKTISPHNPLANMVKVATVDYIFKEAYTNLTKAYFVFDDKLYYRFLDKHSVPADHPRRLCPEVPCFECDGVMGLPAPIRYCRGSGYSTLLSVLLIVRLCRSYICRCSAYARTFATERIKFYHKIWMIFCKRFL